MVDVYFSSNPDFFPKGVEETKGEGRRKFWKKIIFIHSINKKKSNKYMRNVTASIFSLSFSSAFTLFHNILKKGGGVATPIPPLDPPIVKNKKNITFFYLNLNQHQYFKYPKTLITLKKWQSLCSGEFSSSWKGGGWISC